MKEIRDKARELMKGWCRVCPQCDGWACAGQVPGMGGLGTGSSFINNVTALAEVKLNLRTMHKAAQPDLACNFLGVPLSMPVMASPIAGVSFNMSEHVTEADYTEAYAKGCLEAGVMGCLGDGALEIVPESSFATLEKTGGRAIMFCKPWEQEKLFQRFDNIAKTNAPMVGVDVDAAGLITLALMGKPVTPKTPEHLRELVNYLKVPFIVKGIMTTDEALLAMEAGAKAIIVSNHGGRVLDHTPGTAQVLPEIADAVKGRIKIIVDGGVRSGADVLKMLALGADLVMIGRPVAVAALGGGAQGVVKYMAKIKSELTSAMVMTGCASLADITPRILTY